MSEKKWRFPDNNYTDEKGLDTSDMEIFKKDPIASLLVRFVKIQLMLLMEKNLLK